MSVVVKNNLATILDIPGLGLMFAVGEEQTVDSITAPLAAAIQAGQILLISQVATALVVVRGTGTPSSFCPSTGPGRTRSTSPWGASCRCSAPTGTWTLRPTRSSGWTRRSNSRSVTC